METETWLPLWRDGVIDRLEMIPQSLPRSVDTVVGLLTLPASASLTVSLLSFMLPVLPHIRPVSVYYTPTPLLVNETGHSVSAYDVLIVPPCIMQGVSQDMTPLLQACGAILSTNGVCMVGVVQEKQDAADTSTPLMHHVGMCLTQAGYQGIVVDCDHEPLCTLIYGIGHFSIR